MCDPPSFVGRRGVFRRQQGIGSTITEDKATPKGRSRLHAISISNGVPSKSNRTDRRPQRAPLLDKDPDGSWRRCLHVVPGHEPVHDCPGNLQKCLHGSKHRYRWR